MMKQGVLDTLGGMAGPVNPVPPPPMLTQAVGQQSVFLPPGVYHFRTQVVGRVVDFTLRIGVVEPEDAPNVRADGSGRFARIGPIIDT